MNAGAVLCSEVPPHPLGIRPRYVRTRDGARGLSLRALLAGEPLCLDPAGTRAAFGLFGTDRAKGAAQRTCFRGVRRERTASLPPAAPAELLRERLQLALGAALAGPDAVIALSGGLDSALLVALARAAGFRPLLATLATPFPGYDESERAGATARAFGLDLLRVEVGERDFLAALPDAVAIAETPFFNLHPVGKLLFARALARRGARTVVTGDGADQAFAGAPPALWLPLATALVEGGGVVHSAPFLDLPVLAVARSAAGDPEKRCLRRLARELGVPESVAAAPKAPRYAPALDVARWLGPAAASRFRSAAGRAPDFGDDRDRVRAATLDLLWRSCGGE